MIIGFLTRTAAVGSVACLALSLGSVSRADDEKVIERDGTYTTSTGS
jgi:uncharacterized membrane protein YphA (DoxX/SURF4 family)